MNSMIHAIWSWWKGSPVIANASGRSFIIAANAVSNSTLRPPFAVRMVEGDVLAFEITEIAHPVAEGLPPGRVIEDADTRDLRRLLRARRKRPRRCCTAEQREELASSDVGHGLPSGTRC